MNEKKKTVEERFYQDCAALLKTSYEYSAYPYNTRTRWNNRAPGNGRFPGFGLIRLFGDRVHMQLRAPVSVNRWFASREEAVRFLAKICA